MNTQIHIKKITDWGSEIKSKPLFIAGPCSAETEKQVLKTAVELKKIGINIFRAGIWKPRTRPNSFEGVGRKGLDWLKLVQKETGMLVATEVANVKHTYDALKAGIDILWVGARTTANPFAIQEIADVLKGLDIPVLIKNPINPDVDLWIGAIERFQNAGLTNIGAIHRGFSSFEKSIYRNTPQWQIPIELKRKIPDIPLICDPSHIAGNRELIQSLSQKAIDLNFDGLMIETHPNPDLAWSDAKQQITPETLFQILNSLILREELPLGVSLEAIEDLRYKIDKCDDDLINILEKRMNLVKAIGLYKKENKMTILQPGRWDQVLGKSIEKGIERNLNKDFITSIFKTIHQESINKQTIIMNE